jgi:hypothetical protein
MFQTPVNASCTPPCLKIGTQLLTASSHELNVQVPTSHHTTYHYQHNLVDLFADEGLENAVTNFDVIYTKLLKHYDANGDSISTLIAIVAVCARMCSSPDLCHKLFEKGTSDVLRSVVKTSVLSAREQTSSSSLPLFSTTFPTDPRLSSFLQRSRSMPSLSI